jgi:hypothetical protein
LKGRSRLKPAQSGIAAQHYVAAEISRRGHAVAMTVRNAQGVDILASRLDGSRAVGIQVKCGQDSGKWWMLDAKAERMKSRTLVYVLVNLNGPGGSPTFHVVPSTVVATSIAREYRAYMKGRRRDGGRRKESRIRRFLDKQGNYVNRWDLLGLD